MADEQTPIQTTSEELAREIIAIVFEDILPWNQGQGDTGQSSRLKLKRNFDKIRAWIDAAYEMFLSRLHDDNARGRITFDRGLTTYNDDDRSLPAVDVRGDAVFRGNLSSQTFISGFPGGTGWALQKKEFTNSAGEVEYKYILECDGANIRNALRVYEFIISQLLGENDNRIFTAMIEVDHYDPETGKVWLNTNCGKLHMPLRANDCIMVQQSQPGGDVENGGDGYITKSYELLITEVGTGGAVDENGDRLDWVRFANFSTLMENGTAEELITKGDTFCRVDNLTDPERKGIIQMFSVGTNAPYMDILYGLKTDPQRALKSRLGNLQGVRTEDFGWLKGFGIYTNNFYGTGEFRNAQTGESLTAKINTTRTKHTSVYKETTYDISEDSNHVSNGFFVRELEDWTPCSVSGSAIATQGHTGILNTGGTPLLVNGQLVSTSSRQQAILTDLDGLPVLKLNNAGVSQDFTDMVANTTHKVMTSAEGTTMDDEEDRLYMGIRILPLTEGTLKVEFQKQGALSEGWQRNVIATGTWMTLQAQDTAQAAWDFSGTGKMVVSYTGQCFIRFVALTNDPVESLKVDYMTRVTQTARLWRVEAEATYATLTMHSELSVTVQGIATEVTNNKAASDRAKAAIEARLGVIETFDNNTATWITQTNSTINLWATSFENDGSVKGLSQLRLDVNGLQTTVGTLATTAAVQSYVNSLNTRIDNANTAINNNATAISQTNSSIANIVAQFNADGTLKTSSSLALYIQEHTSFFDIQADVINFNFTKRWDVYSGSNKVMGLDTQGNLWIKGEYRGGTITQNVTVGTTGSKMEIYCDKTVVGNLKASGISGKDASGNTVLTLGFSELSGASTPYLSMRGNEVYTLFRPDTISFHSITGNLPPITLGYSLGDGKLYFSTWLAGWPTRDEVGVGRVFLGDDEILRVRRS